MPGASKSAHVTVAAPAVLAWLLGVFLLVVLMDQRLPEPLALADLQQVGVE